MLTRRAFLPLLAMPAIVKFASLMPVSSAKLVIEPEIVPYLYNGQIMMVSRDGGYLYSELLSDVLRSQVVPLTKLREHVFTGDVVEFSGMEFKWSRGDDHG